MLKTLKIASSIMAKKTGHSSLAREVESALAGRTSRSQLGERFFSSRREIKPAGLISLGSYLPGKSVPLSKREEFSHFLKKHTQLYPEYIDPITQEGKLPGSIETNQGGWESKPWYNHWLKSLPEKKQQDPFQGAKERRRVPLDPVSIRESIHPHPMLSSDAEVIAGACAIFNGNINHDDIDLVVTSSLVPDRNLPPNASLLQHKLGLKNAGAYNMDTCCSSFVTMLDVAMSLVESGRKKMVLIVASALDSHTDDRTNYYSINTGDGVVAGIISAVEPEFGYMGSHSTSHGDRHAAIVFQERSPVILRTTTQGPTYSQEFTTFFDMDMCKAVAANAQADMQEVVSETLRRAGLTIEDVDFFVTHQPVAWTANAWREQIGIPVEKFHESFESNGNIACASAPANLTEAIEKGLIKTGDKVLMGSSGAGENHIALLQRVSSRLIESTARLAPEVDEKANEENAATTKPKI